MSAGLVIAEFFKNPWYNRTVNRVNKLGATLEAASCLKDQISTLSTTTVSVPVGTEAYGLIGDIMQANKRISPMVNPQRQAPPRLTYQVIDTDPSNIKYAASMLDTVLVKINCHAKSVEQATALLKEVRVLFERYQGTLAGVKVQSVSYVGEKDLYSESADLVGISQEYNLRLQRHGGY